MAWEMGKLSACRVPFMTSDGYLADGCTPSASNVHGHITTRPCVVLFRGDRLKGDSLDVCRMRDVDESAALFRLPEKMLVDDMSADGQKLFIVSSGHNSDMFDQMTQARQ